MKRLAKLLVLAVAVYAVATEGGRERLKPLGTRTARRSPPGRVRSRRSAPPSLRSSAPIPASREGGPRRLDGLGVVAVATVAKKWFIAGGVYVPSVPGRVPSSALTEE